VLGRLAYVALVVSEVERVAAGLARDFGWQRRIAFLDRRALGGVLVHLVEREAPAG
jgi:hypothetical protein